MFFKEIVAAISFFLFQAMGCVLFSWDQGFGQGFIISDIFL